MGIYSKALLVVGKALPQKSLPAYHQAMLSTSEKMAQKMRLALADARLTQTELAARCGVSKQAVQSWVKTGRVDKKHITAIAQATGKPLEWWLDAPEASAALAQPAPTKCSAQEKSVPYRSSAPPWPFVSISHAQYALLSDAQKAQAEAFVKYLLTEAAPQNKSRGAQRAA